MLVSEFVGNDYVYIAFDFNNPCPSSQYVVPLTTLDLGNGDEPVPTDGTAVMANCKA